MDVTTEEKNETPTIQKERRKKATKEKLNGLVNSGIMCFLNQRTAAMTC